MCMSDGMRCKGVCLLLFSLIFFASSCVTSVSDEEAASVYYNLGNAYFELEKYDEASNAYLRAIELDSSLGRASYNLARVYLQSGRTDRGIEVLKTLLAADPENTKVLNTLAYGYTLIGDIDAALEEYEKVLAISPLNENALYNQGVLLWKKEDFKGARRSFITLYERQEENADLLGSLGLLEKETGNIELAIRYLEDYLEMEPEDFEIMVELARLYEEEEYYGKAVEWYNAAIVLGPEMPELFFGKARVLLSAIADAEEGYESLNRALQLGFDNKEQIAELYNREFIVERNRLEALLKQYNLLPLSEDGFPEKEDTENTGLSENSKDAAEETAAPY